LSVNVLPSIDQPAKPKGRVDILTEVPETVAEEFLEI